MAEAEQSRNNQNARQAMLDSIRRHLSASARFDAVHAEHLACVAAAAPAIATPAIPAARDSLLDRFRKELSGLAGRCIVVPDEPAAAAAVQEIVAENGAGRIAISDSPLVRRVIGLKDFACEFLERPKAVELFDCDIGITSAQWLLCETATLVLDAAVEQHRLASLVPPVHIAICESNRLRASVGEVLEALSQRAPADLSRTITFVTGPSRTSDIELKLAIGVHGPGRLYVIIIESQA